MPTSHEQFLTWLGTPDCTCPWAWRSLGRLYGVAMGHSWVRLATDPVCPHHGSKSDHLTSEAPQ